MKSHLSSQDNVQLAQVNQKIIKEGEVLPVVTLKDGTGVQTGTVATMLYNIQLYDAGERGRVETELELAIPTLFKVGLFDLFPPTEWVLNGTPGRQYVGRKAIEFLGSL